MTKPAWTDLELVAVSDDPKTDLEGPALSQGEHQRKEVMRLQPKSANEEPAKTIKGRGGGQWRVKCSQGADGG